MAVQVEIFSSPGCNGCRRARQAVKKIVQQIGAGRIAWREVSVLEEMDYAVRLGVLATPAIAINGRLVFTALPTAGKLRKVLEQALRS
jgi:protein-disulfide isomerase